MRQDVIDRQVCAMKEAGLDAIVSCSPENFAYVTGFLSPTQPLMRWRHALAWSRPTARRCSPSSIWRRVRSAPSARGAPEVPSRGVERVRVRRHGGARRPADASSASARARIGIETGLSAGRRFRRPLPSCCRTRSFSPHRPARRGASDQDAEEIAILRKLSRIADSSSRRPTGRSPPARPRWILPPR